MSTTAIKPSEATSQCEVALRQIVHDYINKTQWATLATVREDGAPVLRVMGSFAPNGVDVIFSTRKNVAKVRQIAKNNLVNFFFQHENQALDTFKNVAIIGRAEELTSGPEYTKAVDLLSARNPRFKARVESGELADTAIYLIRTTEIKYLDYSKGHGPSAVREIII